MDRNFTKEKTLMLKGIAIMLLLYHHIFYETFVDNNPTKQLFLIDDRVMRLICKYGAISIFIFSILSGFGLAASLSDGNRDYRSLVIEREQKLLSLYIPLYIIGLIGKIIENGDLLGTIHSIYGESLFRCLVNICMEFFAISNFFGMRLLNPTMWYMAPAHIIIFIVPVYCMMDKKNSQYGTGVLAVIIMYAATHQQSVFFDCLMSGCIGAWIYNHETLQRVSALFEKKRKIWEFMIIIIWLGFYILADRSSIFNFYFGSGLLMPVMMFLVNDFIAYIPAVRRVLILLGKNSAGIFMFHTYVYLIWEKSSDFVFAFDYAWQTYMIVLIISVVVSWGVKCFVQKLKIINRNNR